MSLDHPLALLSGIFLQQPLVGFGLVPSSSQPMTRHPASALGYSLTGGLMILGLGSSAWLIHHLLLEPLGLMFMELPVLLLAMWGWQRLIGRIFSRFRLITDSLPLYFLNLAVLGSGLPLIHSAPNGIAQALLGCTGIALGYTLSTILISFFRERAEPTTISRTLQGWPAFLLACALFWLGWQAIASLFKG
jgi:Na+-translocating ferredoxin:NAD+ oxidoreductase RnfA subunit